MLQQQDQSVTDLLGEHPKREAGQCLSVHLATGHYCTRSRKAHTCHQAEGAPGEVLASWTELWLPRGGTPTATPIAGPLPVGYPGDTLQLVETDCRGWRIRLQWNDVAGHWDGAGAGTYPVGAPVRRYRYLRRLRGHDESMLPWVPRGTRVFCVRCYWRGTDADAVLPKLRGSWVFSCPGCQAICSVERAHAPANVLAGARACGLADVEYVEAEWVRLDDRLLLNEVGGVNKPAAWGVWCVTRVDRVQEGTVTFHLRLDVDAAAPQAGQQRKHALTEMLFRGFPPGTATGTP